MSLNILPLMGEALTKAEQIHSFNKTLKNLEDSRIQTQKRMNALFLELLTEVGLSPAELSRWGLDCLGLEKDGVAFLVRLGLDGKIIEKH